MIAIFDFGGQYTRLIARRVREAGVYSEIVPAGTTLGELRARGCEGVILSGGPNSVYDTGAPSCDLEIFTSTLPVLGICYGMQVLAQVLGGTVQPATGRREYGPATIDIADPADALFADLAGAGPLEVWMNHGDSVTVVPDGFRVTATSVSNPIAAMAHPRGLVGVQFHPEVQHTPQGGQMLHNFLFTICHCVQDWTTANVIESAITRLREQIGGERVICGLSGGVDSAVTALLIHRAVGEQLTCVFVDHGLLRQGEAEQVVATFRDTLRIPLVVAGAKDRFLSTLAGIEDPETKRKRIGETFIRVFEDEAARLGEVRFLAQGTLYPDVIETHGPRHGSRADDQDASQRRRLAKDHAVSS